MFLDDLKFRSKIMLILIASVAGMVVLIGLSLTNLKTEMMDSRRLKTQHIVETASSLVAHYVEAANYGTMMEDDAKQAALEAVKALRYGDGQYFWISDMENRMVMDPFKQELDGKDLSDLKDAAGKAVFTEMTQTAVKNQAGFIEYLWPKPGSTEALAKIAYVNGLPDWGWIIGSGIYVDDVETAFKAELAEQGIRITVIMAVVLALSYLVGSRMIRAMGNITQTMHRLAAGDVSAQPTGAKRRDEIGDMARSVMVFRDNAIAMHSMREDQEQERRNSEAERRRVLTELADELETGVSSAAEAVNAAAEQMRGAADGMSGGADRTASEIGLAAHAVELTAGNVQTMAAAAEELNASIGEISRQVGQSTDIAKDAVESAQDTDIVVRGLTDAVGRIGEVVQLINTIAAQTNLLALNATIEAARAGEAGKGFAVVANEVKTLANQTAKATNEISTQISTIQGAAGNVAGAIGRIGRTINSMADIAESIAAAVEQQGAATQEIARSIGEAAQGAQEVENHIAVVRQAAGDTGESAREVLAAASHLAEESQNLNAGLTRFLGEVRKM